MRCLGTPRLLLEPLDVSHADALHALYRDPEVARHLITRPASRAAFQEVFARALAFASSHGMWALRSTTLSPCSAEIGMKCTSCISSFAANPS